ncbi:MAG: PilZ domain-containing protein [Nitrospinae bacterium]|nr:PilZ domain-containing protein [Nitrospinota bacterium]
MEKKNEIKGRFIILCLKERQPKYDRVLAGLLHEIILVESMEPLVRFCIETPPSGVLIDMASGARIGSSEMAILDNLKVTWPIIRCNVSADGSVRVMHKELEKTPLLPQALDFIVQRVHNKEAKHLGARHIRINVRCRTRFQVPDDGNWRPGNVLNLSMGGAFILTHDPPQIGEPVLLEFLDLFDSPLKCSAKTAWVRRWEESDKLPGVGVAFQAETFEPGLKKALEDFLVKSFFKARTFFEI